jgi:hypothetical protein
LLIIPLSLPALLSFIARGFEEDVFRWSRTFDVYGIVLAAIFTLAVMFAVWTNFVWDKDDYYVVRVKTKSGWTNVWATLDAALADQVAAGIRNVGQGLKVTLSLGRTFHREDDVFAFGNQSYRLSDLSSAARRERGADHFGGLGSLLFGVLILTTANSLSSLARSAFGNDATWRWASDILAVMGILFLLAFVVQLLRTPIRYVHLVQLRGTSGRRNVYATLDQAEADAIVADINSAIAAR